LRQKRGQVRHQPLRHSPPRHAQLRKGLRSVQGNLRRRPPLAPARLVRLHGPPALLENRRPPATLPGPLAVVVTPRQQPQVPPPPTSRKFARLPAEEVWSARPKKLITTPMGPPTTNPAATRPFYPLATQPTKELDKQKKLAGYRVTWTPTATGKPVFLWAIYS